MRSRWKTALLTLVVLAGVQGALATLYLMLGPDDDAAPEAATAARLRLIEIEAPPLQLRRLDGTSRPLPQGPALLHFWATWCKPCREELPSLLAFSRREGLPLVAVNVGEAPEAVHRYFDGEVPPEVALGEKGVTGALGFSLLPQTFLVANDDHLRLQIEGKANWDDPALRETLMERAPW